MARKQARQAAVKPADTAPPPPKGDAPSAEPAFEPDTTWEGTAWVMLCIIYGSWFLLLAAGARAYEGESWPAHLPAHLPRRLRSPWAGSAAAAAPPPPARPPAAAGEPVRVKPHQLPLYQFDQMFRAAGGAFIFGMWALRACATYMLPRADHTATLWVPLALHAALGALRLAVYRAHAAGLIFAASRWAAPAPSGHVAHVMSDHILLAAAAVGGLAVEAAMPLLSVRGARGAADVKSMRSYAKLATAMAVVLGWECYYTARRAAAQPGGGGEGAARSVHVQGDAKAAQCVPPLLLPPPPTPLCAGTSTRPARSWWARRWGWSSSRRRCCCSRCAPSRRRRARSGRRRRRAHPRAARSPPWAPATSPKSCKGALKKRG